MTPEQRTTAAAALFTIQIVSLILVRLGEGETPIDPAAVEWLGKRLEAAYEAADGAMQVSYGRAGA